MTEEEVALEEAARWLSRLASSGAARETRAEFKDWLAADRRNAVAMELVELTWASSSELAHSSLPRRAAESRRATARWEVRWTGYGIAAAVVAVAVTAFAIELATPAEVLSTQRGAKLTRRLPDGSTLILNTATEVRLRYGPFAREVRLVQGEAAFQVAHERFRPFVVLVNAIQVKAIGTRFAVRDFGSDASVFLDEGVVELSAPGRKTPRTVLRAKQTARVASSGKVITLTTFDPERALAWRQGRIVFDHTPIGQALAEFGRYSSLSVSADPGVAAMEVSGVYRTGNLESFATAAARMHGLRLERPRPGVLVLHPAS